MDRRIKECLENKKTDYILPFFWQHGEEHERLREEIVAMKHSGVNSFCVESRTHEQFCEDKWWEDFGFILKTAKEMDMKVWLLDDKRFPTGYALGVIQDQFSHLRKRYLYREVVDVLGPQKETALLTNFYTKDGDRVLRAVAYKRTGEGLDCEGEGIDLTATYEDDLVYFDIPEGMWRVFFMIETDRFQTTQPYFIDKLNSESTDLMISQIYQPHYDHFKEYFGTTMVGFFSDEPGFGNEAGTYFSTIGKPNMVLPWNPDLIPLLGEKLSCTDDEVWALMPGLWADIGENTAKIRVAFMDAVTRLYAKNFTEKLANWSREHGVMYIGHIIEDMNACMHLGNSAGHYFRALDAQDMAGIDVVLQQVMPGQNDMLHTARIYDRIADPTFFVYALAKLAASHSHINPAMKNRAMCEIYGAYGFAEGVSFMKKLSDHFLASGINRYVPHAFTPKYPDKDCPPHFYCGGMNPQFELFGDLMRYKQRVIHALEGGIHQASALIYFNAESEWSGSKTNLYFEAAKALTQNQIDFDFVPLDYMEKIQAEKGKLTLNQESYLAMVIPGCTHIPQALDQELARFHQAGVPVLFFGDLPEKLVEGGVPSCRGFAGSLAPDKAGEWFREKIGYDIRLSKPCPYLRFYHIKRDGVDVYMFKNDAEEALDTTVIFPVSGEIAVYDAWKNTLTKRSDSRLRLAPGESIIWILGEDTSALAEIKEFYDRTEETAELLWDIDMESVEDKERKPYKKATALYNLGRRGELTHFSGKLYYRAKASIAGGAQVKFLDLGYVGETAKLTVNGEDCGTQIVEPYVFDVEGKLKDGENTIEIEVVANPVYRERDDFSRFMRILPMGILGPVKYLR